MSPVLADSHTHLEQYTPPDLAGVLKRTQEAGVGLIITAGSTIGSSAQAIDLAQRYPLIYAGVGIHPMRVRGPVDEADYKQLRELALSHPKVVCISEIGLDFMERAPDLAFQEQALRQQMRLARELRLPVIFHSQVPPDHLEAHYRTFQVLREEGVREVGAIMHYFQADAAVAQACLELGFLIALARPILRLPHLEEVVKGLPLDSIVLETDAAPTYREGRRSRWTEPQDLRPIAQKVAQVKGITPEQVAEATTANLLRFLGGRVSL